MFSVSIWSVDKGFLCCSVDILKLRLRTKYKAKFSSVNTNMGTYYLPTFVFLPDCPEFSNNCVHCTYLCHWLVRLVSMPSFYHQNALRTVPRKYIIKCQPVELDCNNLCSRCHWFCLYIMSEFKRGGLWLGHYFIINGPLSASIWPLSALFLILLHSSQFSSFVLWAS